jgi:uncharacterized membrane protein
MNGLRASLVAALATVRGSFWFLPAVIVALATALAAAMLTIDRSWPAVRELTGLWLYGGSADGARELLSTLGGAMVGLAGVVFSITIVILTLASNQLGPRLLRTFRRDRGNQVVLGAFMGTFTYSLVVLRSVRAGDETEAFVPQASVTVAVALALGCVGLLVYFIHHVSEAIQADNVVAAVAAELHHAFDRLGRSGTRESAVSAVDLPPGFDRAAQPIVADRSGYVRVIDVDAVLGLATEADLVVRLVHRAGDFVIEGDALAVAGPAERVAPAAERTIRRAVVLGPRRTAEQDPEFAINQLVEVALRALSPGINDPYTAMSCVDWLGSALCRLADRESLPRGHVDRAGRLRVVDDAVTLTGLVDAAFEQIRQAAASHVAVAIRLLEAQAAVLRRARSAEMRAALVAQADMVKRAMDAAPLAERDRRDVETRYRALRAAAGAAAA